MVVDPKLSVYSMMSFLTWSVKLLWIILHLQVRISQIYQIWYIIIFIWDIYIIIWYGTRTVINVHCVTIEHRHFFILNLHCLLLQATSTFCNQFPVYNKLFTVYIYSNILKIYNIYKAATIYNSTNTYPDFFKVFKKDSLKMAPISTKIIFLLTIICKYIF